MLSEHLLEEIIGIVHQCGEIMLSATDIDRKMHQKTGKGNFVTEYDSRVQQVLEEKLLALVPGAVFLGEEDQMDQTDISRGYAFIVDPIDGTANFTRGYNVSCISVERGKGAYRNREQIHASQRTLKEGLILFGTAPYHQDLMKKSFEVAYRYMSQGEDLRRSGSAALDLCAIASGKAEFYFEMRLCPWDYAAGALLVEEAGGIVSDLEGNPVTYDRKQTVTARGPQVELL